MDDFPNVERQIGKFLYAGPWRVTPWYIRLLSKKPPLRRLITTEADTFGPSWFWEYDNA